jgi:hypothetical protein
MAGKKNTAAVAVLGLLIIALFSLIHPIASTPVGAFETDPGTTCNASLGQFMQNESAGGTAVCAVPSKFNSILPAADNTYNLGSSALRWATGFFSNAVQLFAAKSDANPTLSLENGAVKFGAGGNLALESELMRPTFSGAGNEQLVLYPLHNPASNHLFIVPHGTPPGSPTTDNNAVGLDMMQTDYIADNVNWSELFIGYSIPQSYFYMTTLQGGTGILRPIIFGTGSTEAFRITTIPTVIFAVATSITGPSSAGLTISSATQSEIVLTNTAGGAHSYRITSYLDGNLYFHDNTAGADRFSIQSNGNIFWNTIFSRYNNINTQGLGVPAVYASFSSTANTGVVTNAINYSPPATAGSYRLCWQVDTTISTTNNFHVVGTWKDASGNARSQTLGGTDPAGNALVAGAITNTIGTGVYSGCTEFQIDNSATAITLSTSGTFTTVTYNIDATLEQLA